MQNGDSPLQTLRLLFLLKYSIYGKIQQTSGYQDEIRNDIGVIETRTMEGFDHQPYLLRCIGHLGLLISG